MEEIKKKQEELMAEVFESTKLSDKEKALVSLTVSILSNDNDAYKNACMLAKQSEYTNCQIEYVSYLVSMLQTGRNIKMVAKKESCCSSERCC